MTALRRRPLLAGAAASLALPGIARAQARPVTIVVAYPAGGDTDAIARIYAERLAPRLGRPVVVENRSGASGAVGSIWVARQAPDGDTLMLAPSTFPIVPHVLRAAAYDPVRDFSPIILTGTSPMLLVASRQSGIRTLADILAQAQAGRLQEYGSPGSGSPMHMLGEMLNRATGMRLNEVAYRGVAPVINDILGGQIAIGYVTPGAVMQHLRANTMTPVATSEAARTPLLPEVPTFAEAGYRDMDVTAWWGLYGPPGMQPAVVQTLNRHMNEVIRLPEVEDRIRALAIVTGGGTPERLTEVTRTDYERFGRLVREMNVRVE
ncbi:MAG: tripartite tricarboxylate transporter substrate binding protein [Acetobacteraceae bacterium]|nr:tripartite tricarboxylate transporter substrate binding protein [Acetobacteraceae bacterium]